MQALILHLRKKDQHLDEELLVEGEKSLGWVCNYRAIFFFIEGIQ